MAFLLGETTDPAHAQCDRFSFCATEWSSGSVINLGGLPGFPGNEAFSIDNAGVAAGASSPTLVPEFVDATEWSRGRVIVLGGLQAQAQRHQRRRADSWTQRPERHRVERRQRHQPRRPARLRI